MKYVVKLPMIDWLFNIKVTNTEIQYTHPKWPATFGTLTGKSSWELKRKLKENNQIEHTHKKNEKETE